MRPDTRSFSFTWLRGAQHQEELNLGRPTTRSQTVDRTTSNYSSMETTDESSPETQRQQAQPQKPTVSAARLKLRRLESSLLHNITNNLTKRACDLTYDFIDEADLFGRDKGEDSVTSDQTENLNSVKPSLSIGKRLNKTVQDVKSTLENMSQRFRRSTSRRYRMKAESPATPGTPTRRILGRTPTKLYSPFGFDTPQQKTPKRLGADRGTNPRHSATSVSRGRSGAGKEDENVKDIRRGLNKFQLISRGMTRRSVRF